MSLKPITPYKDSTLGKKKQVAKMFDTISENYDGLNRVISFGIDRSWRKNVVKMVLNQSEAKHVLDVATGTADLAIQLVKNGVQKVVGLDISSGMLEIGKKKTQKLTLDHKIELVLGDGEKIPFEDNSFDAITVAFGVRNFENLTQGLSEILRVLKPKGVFVVLETSIPTKFPFKQGYKIYTKVVLPIIGKLFSRDKVAYKYLSDSANEFPYGDKFIRILEQVGFKQGRVYPQTLGVASIYYATKG